MHGECLAFPAAGIGVGFEADPCADPQRLEAVHSDLPPADEIVRAAGIWSDEAEATVVAVADDFAFQSLGHLGIIRALASASKRKPRGQAAQRAGGFRSGRKTEVKRERR
jgi:hypothetical protein